MDFRRTWLALLLAAGAAVVIGGAAEAAKPNAGNGRRPTRPASVQAPSRVTSIDNVRRIDVNTINMFLTNYGSFAWDLTSGNAGLIWPKGTTKTAVFAAGLWMGAQVAGATRQDHREHERAGEPDRHRHAEGDARERLVGRPVHRAEGHPERDDRQPGRRGAPADPRAGDGHEDHGRDQQRAIESRWAAHVGHGVSASHKT